VPELTALLDHQDPDVRMHAAIALGEIGQASAPAIPQIVARLQNDEFESVRFAAAFALGKINQPDTDATKALILAAKEDAPLLRTMSWWALARLYPEREDLVRGAAKKIGEGLTSEDPHLRAVAARALADFDAAPELVRPVLLKALQDAEPRVVGHAMDALASLGPDVLTDIDGVLQHPQARHYATLVIYRMGPKAAPAVPALVAALQAAGDTEDDDKFRREAQMALAAIGPAAADAVDVLIESLDSESKEVRGSACYALGKIGPAAEKAVPALQQRMSELEDSDQVAFVWALLHIKPGDEPLAVLAAPLLAAALDNPDDLVRVEAAAALGQIGKPAVKPEIIEKLRSLLDDPSPEVQQAAADALEELE
jgi:HEAT repeat protein